MIAFVETADELRVLASERKKSLPQPDRELLKRAAGELEAATSALLAARSDLADALSRRAALTERLAEAERYKRPVTLSSWHLRWSGAQWRS